MIHNWLLVAFAFFGLGVFCGDIVFFPLLILVVVLFILFVVTVTFIWRQQLSLAIIVVITIFFILGMLRGTLDKLVDPQDISRYLAGTAIISGEIVAVGEMRGDAIEGYLYQCDVKVESIKIAEKKPVPVNGGVRLYIKHKGVLGFDLPAGGRITAQGSMRLPHSYNNPGAIDRVELLRRQGITVLMNAESSKIKIIPPSKQRWQDSIAMWRKTLRVIMNSVMSPNEAGILSGMLFSGYGGIKPAILKDYAVTGIVHILSVSGTHIALVAGFVLLIMRKIRVSRCWSAVLAGSVVVFYATLSGFSPPVLRSVVMGLTALMALAIGRDNDAPTALMLSAFIMLYFSPSLLYDISFQLSFAATAGLLFLYPRCMKLFSRWPKWLAGAIAVTLSAQLGTLPFLAWYFNAVSLSSFVANILIVPVVEVIVIVGLIGCIVASLFVLAGKIIFVGCSLMIGLVNYFTSLIAKLPYASVYVPTIGVVSGACYYLCLGWFCVGAPRPYWMKKKVLLIGTFALILVAIPLYISTPRSLAVNFIDVGQGDAALIITPHGRSILIDTGGTLYESEFDVGERVVVPYLKHVGVTKLDYLILSHGHQDHAGGAAAIAREIPIARVMLGPEDYTIAVRRLLRSTDAVVIPMIKGQIINVDNLKFTVIHDQTEVVRTTGNEKSCVVRLDYGQHSFLFTGDLDKNGEKMIIKDKPAPVTVLKVCHHGAATSSDEEFLQALSPQYAVISVGDHNRFGHPSPQVLARLAASKAIVFRTDQHGAVTFNSDGKTLQVIPYRK